jgi:ABC-type nitrate/sulfonate/bicarbonate transport system substrate-binding protein
MSTGPRTPLRVGFMPLLDCATLVVAQEKGFAAAEGLDLRLLRETSWANIRDRVAVGHFDAAQLLGPMVVAATLDIGHFAVPMIAPVSLGLGGNAITVSGKLWSLMAAQGAVLGDPPGVQAAALARVVTARERAGTPPLSFAMVFPFSCHNYELRYWLASAGLNPDRDLRLVVLPPPLLVDALRSGQIDGFCVGEPWNSLAVETGLGCIVAATSDIWRRGPEKVLGMRLDWAERHPAQVAGLVRAIDAAARWCDDAYHHAELASLLAEPRYVGVPSSVLCAALGGQLAFSQGGPLMERPEFIVFSRFGATVPRPAHAAWFYSQMRRWGQTAELPGGLDLAMSAYRPDLHAAAVGALSPPAEASDSFFDGRRFDASELEAYLASLR